MKTKVIMLIFAGTMILLVGCATERPTAGVVGWDRQFSVGSSAPDIPFTSLKGEQTTLKHVSQPIAILAFTNPTGETCCWLRPSLVNLANDFRNLPITVTQISVPTSKCPHGPGCVESCNLNDAHLVSLCDADRTAWQAYSQPKPNTAILVDQNGKVVHIEDLGNLTELARRARRLAQEVEETEAQMYEGR